MEAPDLPRERIGPYRLEARLGRGGMGEVFLALDERLERRVAVKRVRWGPRTTAATHERFRREARAAAKLNHPAIVQVYDLVADEDGDAIVMEYVLGRPLASLVGDPALTPALAVRLGREIAQGLAHAHEAGFLHRDLKAENVMVTGAGHAKILDFGLAKPMAPGEEESLTADGAVLGTFHAMSPEQAGGGEVDERSDLFSLGALLYEMLAGCSAFRSESPLATLKKVLTEAPVPLGSLRPDLPPELVSLVDRLLAKDRAARPRNASEVARRLAEIEGLGSLPAAAGEGLSGEALSELPTGPAPAGAPRLPAAAPTPGVPAPRRRPRVAYLVAASLLALAGALGAVLYERSRAPAPILRVLVPPPTVSAAGDPRLALAASGVLDAALGSLAALQGLAPLDPAQLGGRAGAPRSPAEMARTAAADEVLLATVEPEGELARVALRRLGGSDGRVLWAATFKVSSEPANLRLLADAVAVQLRRAYPDHPARAGTPDLAVRDEDYAAYLEVQRRLDEGRTPPHAELARLTEILDRSPRFLAARITAAEVALSLFASTREASSLESAQAWTRQAEALAPGDPRPEKLRFRVELARHQGQDPERALARIAAAFPGDPEILTFRADLEELRGRTADALADRQAAVARVPSWRNLRQLAELEARTGRTAEARAHLRQLLDRSPGNLWGLGALAALELAYGDPARAEAIYQDLIATRPPQRGLWTNLGLARFLAGHPGEAIDAYRKALELAPGHPTVLLDLADAELALGREEAAREHYRAALARLQAIAAANGLSPEDTLYEAQCLARLGRTGEAAELAQHSLEERPGEPDVAYGAALVYALVGDKTSARLNARAALRQGYGPRWFGIAAFDFLRNDPELRALLTAGTRP